MPNAKDNSLVFNNGEDHTVVANAVLSQAGEFSM